MNWTESDAVPVVILDADAVRHRNAHQAQTCDADDIGVLRLAAGGLVRSVGGRSVSRPAAN